MLKLKKKLNLGTKHPRNLGHYEKIKFMKHRYREREETTQDKGTENIFNKITEEKFPNPKKEVIIKVEEAYRRLNKQF